MGPNFFDLVLGVSALVAFAAIYPTEEALYPRFLKRTPSRRSSRVTPPATPPDCERMVELEQILEGQILSESDWHLMEIAQLREQLERTQRQLSAEQQLRSEAERNIELLQQQLCEQSFVEPEECN